MALTEPGVPGEFPGSIEVRLRSSVTAGAIVVGARLLIALLCLCGSPGVSASAQSAAGESQLGNVEFNVSCNRREQAIFNETVAWLHSFECERAGAAADRRGDRVKAKFYYAALLTQSS